LKIIIDQKINPNPEIKQQLEIEKVIHLHKAEIFYSDLKLFCTEAIEIKNIEISRA